MKILDEMKLAIYEKEKNGEITKEERDALLEAAEKKYGDADDKDSKDESGNPDSEDAVTESVLACVSAGDMTYEEAVDLVLEAKDTESANKVYVKAMKEARDGFNDTLKEIKEDIKSGNYIKAKSKIVIANAKLKHLKNLVDKTPSALSDDALSLLASYIKTMGQAVLTTISVQILTKDDEMGKTVGDAFITGKIIQTVIPLLTNGEFTTNRFKANATKMINANMAALKELDKKLDKAKKAEKSKFQK